MEKNDFQEVFECMKGTLEIEKYASVTPSSDWLGMREKIKELGREMCHYDPEAGAMIILACYWSRYRSERRNSKIDREFFEYLKWMQENPGKTY